jgi:hypothetical protein
MFAGTVKGTTPATTISLWYISVATGTDSSPDSAEDMAGISRLPEPAGHAALRAGGDRPAGQTSAGPPTSARVCMSNYPFVSRPEDRYPNVCYEEILLSPPQTRGA